MHVNRRVRVLADHATVTEVVEGNVHCRFHSAAASMADLWQLVNLGTGEELAVEYLQKNGYAILETNWTFKQK
jgi:aldehyde:ferredoxin oxidoreductase